MSLAFCSNQGVSPKEHLIERLRELCNSTPGGVDAVAERAEISAEGLRQIVSGYNRLPSGQPRGVGPKLQAALDAKFPGWARLPQQPNAAWPFELVSRERIVALTPTQRGVVESAMLDALQRLEQLRVDAPFRKRAGAGR